MNPYDVLGVNADATDQQIKNAYRQLVKQYHPDKNNSEEARSKIQLINEAYDILTDPQKRSRYNNPFYFVVEAPAEEDPREVYKREYLRRKREEARREAEEKLQRRVTLHRNMRYVAFPLFVFALLLIIDGFLPGAKHEETVLSGYQVSVSKGKNIYKSYMVTRNFSVVVPHHLHVGHDYTESSTMQVALSRIFRLPKECVLTQNGVSTAFYAQDTIHSRGSILKYLLLLNTAILIIFKDYSKFLYNVCSLPIVIFVFILILMK